MNRHDLPEVLLTALQKMGGSATIVEACKFVWSSNQTALKESGDLFYTWQYDIRWAATELRKSKLMKPADVSPRGLWEITKPKQTNT